MSFHESIQEKKGKLKLTIQLGVSTPDTSGRFNYNKAMQHMRKVEYFYSFILQNLNLEKKLSDVERTAGLTNGISDKPYSNMYSPLGASYPLSKSPVSISSSSSSTINKNSSKQLSNMCKYCFVNCQTWFFSVERQNFTDFSLVHLNFD